MKPIVLAVFVPLVFTQAAPLQASGGEIPEPSDLALFALGLIGLIVGRQSIATHKDRRED